MNLIITTIFLAALSRTQQTQPGISMPPPIASLKQTIILPLGFDSERLVGTIALYTLPKRLEIDWSFDAGQRNFTTETFDLDYWPTAAARISDSRLTIGGNILVAGKRPSNGKTVIERWALTVAQSPGPSNPTTISKTTLYEGNAVGKRVVRLMEPVNGIQDRVFVQFDDSDSLYIMNTSNGVLSIIASPAQQPKLADEALKGMTSGRVSGTSYLYVYQSDFSNEDHGALLMYDNNADGMIDSWASLANVQEWEAFFTPSPFQETYFN